MTVTRDAASSKYTPASAAEWAELLSGSGLGAPSSLWLCQESSGTLADSIGSRTLTAELKQDGAIRTIEGVGNGPIDAFVDALKTTYGVEFSFLDYHEHAVGRGANATAAYYVQLQDENGRAVHGVGIDPNIVMASLKAVLSGMQRVMAGQTG